MGFFDILKDPDKLADKINKWSDSMADKINKWSDSMADKINNSIGAAPEDKAYGNDVDDSLIEENDDPDEIAAGTLSAEDAAWEIASLTESSQIKISGEISDKQIKRIAESLRCLREDILVDLDLSKTDCLDEIGAASFAECKSLKSIKFSDDLEEIKENAFKNCTSLQKVELPESVYEIGDGAFSGCSSLRSVNLPDDFSEIDENTFANCTALEDIKFPDDLEEIKKNAFKNCTSLQKVDLPESVYEIGDGAFSGCSSLRSVNLPGDFSEIDENTFANCTALENINIPESVYKIGKGAFKNCVSLKLELPDDIDIADGAFAGCTLLGKTADIDDSEKNDSEEQVKDADDSTLHNENVPQMKPRFCPNCGAKLAVGVKFCSECGTPQKNLFEQQISVEEVSKEEEERRKEEARKAEAKREEEARIAEEKRKEEAKKAEELAQRKKEIENILPEKELMYNNLKEKLAAYPEKLIPMQMIQKAKDQKNLNELEKEIKGLKLELSK